MLKLIYENRFSKDLKKLKKQGKNMQKLLTVITLLVKEKPLAQKYKNHRLKGTYSNYWECHIEPDWFLIYKKTPTEIILGRAGSHSNLF